MIKFSKLADYAVVILAALNNADDALMNASSVSARTSLPEPTVAKVLKLLAKENIVESVRGANGGYKLASSAKDISVAQVVVAVDGPVSLTSCVEGSTEECDYAHCCPVNGRWDDVNLAIKNALESVSLADMIAPKPLIGKNEETHEQRL